MRFKHRSDANLPLILILSAVLVGFAALMVGLKIREELRDGGANAGAASRMAQESSADGAASSAARRRATLSGTYTDCLPRQDNFSTEPCIAGMRMDDGVYYALDFLLMSQIPPRLADGDRFTANGVLIPVEEVDAERMPGAIGAGVFSVTDSVVVTPS